MADMVATSTEAEEDTPLPSGTVEDTCTQCLDVRYDSYRCTQLLKRSKIWLLQQ